MSDKYLKISKGLVPINDIELVYKATSDNYSFYLPTTGVNDYTVDWGDGNVETVTANGRKQHTYATAGEYDVIINGSLTQFYHDEWGTGNYNALYKVKRINSVSCGMTKLAFSNARSLVEVLGENINTANLTDVSEMIYHTDILETLDVSNWDTSKVTTMSAMFNNCPSLTALDVSNFNTSKVTNMSSVFYGCTSLTALDVSNWDTSKVTEMSSMFNNCDSLETLDVSGFNTSNVTNMINMFYGCTSLTALDVSNWNVSKVTNMNSMFNGCTSLETIDISTWIPSSLVYSSYMFEGCTSLTDVDLAGWKYYYNTIRRTDSMFKNCTSLTTIGVSFLKTLHITDMSHMFEGCISLTDVGNLDAYELDNLPNVTSMFEGCTAITASAASVWWAFWGSAPHVNCFTNNTARTNYASIPNDWKGL